MSNNRMYYFVTGNPRKVNEAQEICAQYGVSIVHAQAEMLELQGYSPERVAIFKAEQAYRAIGRTVLVNDSWWSIEALKGFPGGYMHDINRWFDVDDFLALMKDKPNRSIVLTDTLVEYGPAGPRIFKHDTEGYITYQARGNSGPASDRVIVLNNESDRTIAERRDSGESVGSGTAELWRQFCQYVVSEALDEE